MFNGVLFSYSGTYSQLALVPLVPFFICAPLSGWCADARCGNYKVFKVGSVLMFISSVMACLCALFVINMNENSVILHVLSGAISLVVYAIGSVGSAAFIVTAVKLGLDQMPEASPANITSFIAWFVCSISAGVWLLEVVLISLKCTVLSTSSIHWILQSASSVQIQVMIIFPSILMCIVVCSLFLLAPKWLIIEPKCPQSLKTIYQVLKFAAKHKSPLNRSALTYWEENIPSRLDLGKSRYGGPFTTEQVEDVKTFFKVLIVLLPVLPITLGVTPYFCTQALHHNRMSWCSRYFLYAFTYNPFWDVIVITLIYEFCIYPFIKNRLPNILRRIGIVFFFVLLLDLAELIISLVAFYHSLQLSPWSHIAHSVFLSCVVVFVVSTGLEFVCAQSPYRMLGVLLGYAILLYGISFSSSILLDVAFLNTCSGPQPHCLVIQNTVVTALSLIGFILHCVLAHWYKWRVRDEEYDVHRVVEEIYDRYLSHACGH